MALSDRVKTRPAAKHGTPCSVGALLDHLEGAELEALKVMLGDPVKRDGWPADDIYDALVEEGHSVGRQTINRHRGGRCRCGKAAA